VAKKYDIIVIGGGHAGIEAALAAARMGSSVLLSTLSFGSIGQMSCNPAIGGVGKGQLVKEIDALGGEMGLAADRTAIQFRQLNASKGQAVRSSRCQSDRKKYMLYMQNVVRDQSNLEVIEGFAGDIRVKNGRIVGIQTESGEIIDCSCVVIAAGTFLRGRMHTGPVISRGGRIDEPASLLLADALERIGFDLITFKTGTPPRLDGRTIDFSQLEPQYSDDPPVPFSFRTDGIPKSQPLLPCYITFTTDVTHDIIRRNMHLSPMYSGQIVDATGVRYCPSIEDKLHKFPDKKTHHVFLEPDGIDTAVYYPNGISTGLPSDVQEEMVRSINGLQNVKILRYGYSIEHGVIDPTLLKPTLESKDISGLFFCGQVNRTTGYEEAAAQGIIAGINAVLAFRKEVPFIMGRDESYIGVLIDDLITKGSLEPYRMFTSRVEYRLIVREENADIRLSGYGHKLGLLSSEDYQAMLNKYAKISDTIKYLQNKKVGTGTRIDEELHKLNTPPVRQPTQMSEILKRPQVDMSILAVYDPVLNELPKVIADQVEYEIKYEGYIIRQRKDVEKFKHVENIKIPADIDYDDVPSLSNEIRQKLKHYRPLNLGQAHRISGITPAAISILMVYLKKKRLQEK
jgi:tRNA uridine 5-carboxymethylaminomethyl modification enzyme